MQIFIRVIQIDYNNWKCLFQVELTVSRPENPRSDSLEKTPEGLTLLEAIEAKLVYDSSDDDEDDDDDDDDYDEEGNDKDDDHDGGGVSVNRVNRGTIIEKRTQKMFADAAKNRKEEKKRLDREFLLTPDDKQKDG